MWNYRIVRRRDGSHGLHEVYYEGQRASGMTADAIDLCAEADEGPEAIVAMLEQALRDARRYPVLDEAETWPK